MTTERFRVCGWRLSAAFLILAATIVSPSLADAQQPSYADLIQRLDELSTRLEQTEGELEELKARDDQRGQWEASVMRRLPPVDSQWSTVSHRRVASYSAVDPACCLPQESVCGGCPTYCANCLEELGWNKANGWKIVPFGRLRGEMVYSTARQSGGAVVAFLNPKVPGIEEDQFEVHAKQSQVNFAFTGPECGDWQTSGLVMINFMGAQPLRNFSGANIVLAYGEFKNDDWRFAFGRMLDLFSPINPRTVNQLQQRGAGNVGIYRGAFHVDRFITVSETQKWTLSARVAQQDITDYSAIPDIRGQDNGWPNIEARVGLELGQVCDWGRPLEVGLSGVTGETQAVGEFFFDFVFVGAEEISPARGASIDLQLKGEKFGFRGEAFWGLGAGTYFVAMLQTLNPETALPIESKGGWGEVYYRASPRVTFHVGYGVDDPNDGDLGFVNPMTGVGQISYNDVGWANVMWNVTDYFSTEFEVSYRRTDYLDPTASSEAVLVHFASTLTF